jgi:hypothetical protein
VVCPLINLAHLWYLSQAQFSRAGRWSLSQGEERVYHMLYVLLHVYSVHPLLKVCVPSMNRVYLQNAFIYVQEYPILKAEHIRLLGYCSTLLTPLIMLWIHIEDWCGSHRNWIKFYAPGTLTWNCMWAASATPDESAKCSECFCTSVDVEVTFSDPQSLVGLIQSYQSWQQRLLNMMGD